MTPAEDRNRTRPSGVFRPHSSPPPPFKFFLLTLSWNVEGDWVIKHKIYYVSFTDTSESSENPQRASICVLFTQLWWLSAFCTSILPFSFICSYFAANPRCHLPVNASIFCMNKVFKENLHVRSASCTLYASLVSHISHYEPLHLVSSSCLPSLLGVSSAYCLFSCSSSVSSWVPLFFAYPWLLSLKVTLGASTMSWLHGCGHLPAFRARHLPFLCHL